MATIEEKEAYMIKQLNADDWLERSTYIKTQYKILKDLLTEEGYEKLLDYYKSDIFYADYPLIPHKLNTFADTNVKYFKSY